MIHSYAVLLKAHYWDDGVERRVAELRRAAPSADLLLFLDETGGHIAVDDPALTILRHRAQDAAGLGLCTASVRSLFWYCTDYPLYLSAAALDRYDYVVMIEHDVAVHTDLDAMVARAAAEGSEFVADPIRHYDANWFWLPTVAGVYPTDCVQACLTCFCILSRAAWRHLLARRTRLSARYRLGLPLPDGSSGRIEGWPFSEAFMATDLGLHGFLVAPLARYAATDQYDWWPPKLDGTVSTPGIIHPVLAETPYIDSWLRSVPDLSAWFDLASPLYAGLASCDPVLVQSRLACALAERGGGDGLGRLALDQAERLG